MHFFALQGELKNERIIKEAELQKTRGGTLQEGRDKKKVQNTQKYYTLRTSQNKKKKNNAKSIFVIFAIYNNKGSPAI